MDKLYYILFSLLFAISCAKFGDAQEASKIMVERDLALEKYWEKYYTNTDYQPSPVTPVAYDPIAF